MEAPHISSDGCSYLHNLRSSTQCLNQLVVSWQEVLDSTQRHHPDQELLMSRWSKEAKHRHNLSLAPGVMCLLQEPRLVHASECKH